MKLGSDLILGDKVFVYSNDNREAPENKEECLSRVDLWTVACKESSKNVLTCISREPSGSYGSRSEISIGATFEYPETCLEAVAIVVAKWRSEAAGIVRRADATEAAMTD